MKKTKSIIKVTATAAMATAIVANYAIPVFAEENKTETKILQGVIRASKSKCR